MKKFELKNPYCGPLEKQNKKSEKIIWRLKLFIANLDANQMKILFLKSLENQKNDKANAKNISFKSEIVGEKNLYNEKIADLYSPTKFNFEKIKKIETGNNEEAKKKKGHKPVLYKYLS